jgi:hypothetical protein
MISLIILENDYPVFNPEVRMIAPFRRLLERDKGKKSETGIYEQGDSDGRKKLIATKELAFLYFYCDPRSPYIEQYPTDLKGRKEKCVKLVGLPENWVIDADVKEAIAFYESEIAEDFDVKYLSSSVIAAEKTMEYLQNVDYAARDKKGNLLYKPVDVVKVIKETGGVIEALKQLRKKVFDKVNLASRIRGGGETNLFER